MLRWSTGGRSGPARRRSEPHAGLMQILVRRLPRARRPPTSLPSRLAVLVLLLAIGPTAAAASPVAPPGSAALSSARGAPAPVPFKYGQAPDGPPSAPRIPALAGRPAPTKGVWPLHPRPRVVTGFDPPASRWGAGHRGVDLAGTPAAAVHSSLSGTVTFAARIAGRGVVVVSHGRTRTTYEPVAAAVAVGDRVQAGAVVGRLELFGSHCFPAWCLHWGLIEGRDHYLDPLTLVGAAPVRLLPLGGASG